MQISIGVDKADLSKFREKSVDSIEELSKLITTFNYSLGIYKDGIRRKENFVSTSAIGLDFDEDYTLEEAMVDFRNYSHIIAPTKSHRIAKNGKISDRFRVILILSEPITDLETFEATWFDLHANWGAADVQCKDASRFFYPSSEVVSVNKGARIEPVKPKPKPIITTREIDLESLRPGSRGKLAKPVLDFLERGVDEGGRNHSTFKAAKEFQQNLYTLEEALTTITSALEQTGTLARDFTEAEAVNTIKSAYRTEPKHDPRIKPRAFNLHPIGQLYLRKEKLEWIVDNLLTVGGVSLMSSDPKAGKSTLVRQLMRDVLHGKQFLGRQCKQGSVHYYGIEEQVEVVNASFKRLGVRNEDSLLVHIGDPVSDNTLGDFRDLLLETKPALAVIDTLFDFLEVESENNYKEVKRELRKLRQIARETGTHILCVHHNSKGQKDDKRRGNRGILGSQAIAGGVDTIMVLEVENQDRLITSSGREITRWVNRELVWNKKDCTYSLGPQAEDEFQ